MFEKSLAGVDVVASLRKRLVSHPDEVTEAAITEMAAWIANQKRNAWGYVAILVEPSMAMGDELEARLQKLPRGKLGWSDDNDHLPLPECMPCWMQGETGHVAIGKVIDAHVPALRAHMLEVAKNGTHGGIVGRWFPLLRFGSETVLVVKILDNAPANS